jgi:PHS family inorganic phosphate transporter-like MFS transporter
LGYSCSAPEVLGKVLKNSPPAAAAGASHGDRPKWRVVAAQWRPLVGTGIGWLLFDVQFYANSLFASRVLALVFGTGGSLREVLLHNLLVTVLPLLGFVAAGAYFYSTHLSLKALQIAGFLGMAATYLVLAVWLPAIQARPALFVALYALSFVFANAGPNATTFILPTVVFDEPVRATCHGLSAAAGKIGALIGTAAMDPLLSAYGLQVVLYICGAVGVLGALVTLVFIPSDAEPRGPRYLLVAGEEPTDH